MGKDAPGAGGATRWESIWREAEEAEAREPLVKAFTKRIAGDAEHRVSTEFILRHGVAGRAGCRVLEVGSGAGRTSFELARRGSDVTLVDISEAAIRLSRAQFARAGVHGTFRVGDAFALPFPPDSFDVVFSVGLIEDLPPEQRGYALSEMVRVCRPGGRIAVLVTWRGARIYQWGKAIALRRDEWNPGYDELDTVASLWPQEGVSVVLERRVGLLIQLYFLKFVLPARPTLLRYGWWLTWELINRLLWPLNQLPGYFLASVAVKRLSARAWFRFADAEG